MKVPVIILCEKNKKVSRLLRGNPAIKEIIYYENENLAPEMLREIFEKIHKFCVTTV